MASSEHPLGAIELTRDKFGRHWRAHAHGVAIGGWEVTPEAAVVSLMSRAREAHRALGDTAIGQFSQEQKDMYRELDRWFGS